MFIECLFNCMYYRYLVGSESDRNRQCWALPFRSVSGAL